MKRSVIAAAAILLAILVGACAPPPYTPGGIALVYGMADYEGTGSDLNYTDDDAIAVAALLEAQGYTVLSGANLVDATKAAILSDIAAAAAALRPEDTFIFYYSGHGGQVQAPVSSEPESADVWEEYIFPIGSIGYPFDPDLAISDDELCELIAALPVARKVIIIDACNSGGFIGDQPEVDLNPPALSEGSAGGSFLDALTAYVYYSKRDSSDVPFGEAIVLSAAGERELSYESSAIAHGIFTYFLLQTAGSADADGDGYITLGEAYAYIAEMIVSEWNDMSYSTYDDFLPRISGGPVDFVLFGG